MDSTPKFCHRCLGRAVRVVFLLIVDADLLLLSVCTCDSTWGAAKLRAELRLDAMSAGDRSA